MKSDSVVLACKGKEKPKGSNDNSASRNTDGKVWQPGSLLKHPSTVGVLYNYSIVTV